jgi:hypothetical protein
MTPSPRPTTSSHTKARRLEKIADAGAELQADALKSRGPEDAFIYAQTLEGIGPFYASLIVLRATGFADAPLRIPEPRTLNYAAELYDANCRSNASPNSLRTGDRFAPGPPSSSASPPPTPKPNKTRHTVQSAPTSRHSIDPRPPKSHAQKRF